MKRIMLAVVVLCSMPGCEKRPPAQEEKAVAESRALIAALKTNASVRVIRKSDAVREKLKEVKDVSVRDGLIADWREALKNIPVEGLRPSRRYAAVREACHMLNWDLIGAMWDVGSSYEKTWDAYFDTIKWIDRQVAAMKPEKPTSDGAWSWREENDKWDAYMGLAEYRESVIENLEIDEFDKGRYPNDIDKMDAIRAKFEKLIGRPVRKREDITRLGFYAKRARARIQAERDAALGTTRRCGLGEK